YRKVVSYYIPAGKQHLGLKYNAMHTNEDDGNEEVIKSGVVQLSFEARPGAIYEVRYPKPDSFRAAKELAAALKVDLYTNNQLIAQSVVNDMWEVAGAINQLEENAGGETTDAMLTPPTPEAAPSEHLNYWWNKASAAEKKKFLQLIKE
ncbi:MAG: DUF2057 family protein, partial [Gammaproteobacteria bacterium]|nr:DUF2057 family protein [Gammaproteobacteria bacterium]